MSGILREPLQHLRRPFLQRRQILVLQGELILRGADRGVDREILHRLHEQRDAGDVGGLRLQPADDFARARLALVVRLQIDEEAPGIQRHVGAVDADERRQAVDVGVGRGSRRRGPAAARAILSNEIACVACVTPWMTPVSWTGKKPFGIVDVEIAGQHEGAERDEQRQELMVERDASASRRSSAAHRAKQPAAARMIAVRRPAAPASAAARTASAPASARPPPK